MLFFMVAWVGLILTCWLIGVAILNQVKADCFDRIGDRLIIAVWLGVVILSVSLLAVSLVLPLSPLVGAMVAITMAALALSLQDTRAEIRELLSSVSLKWIFGFLALELSVATFTSQLISYYDTGLYHFQVIQWLSRFGAVPGLALIHSRFGFTSSWLALAAPFNAGIFEARLGALTGGFVSLLATLQLLICLIRIWQSRGLLEDWFLVISLFLCILIISPYRMHISPSPDWPLIIMTVVITWIILIIINKNQFHKSYIIEINIVPLILSAGAVTIKLSAIPLLVVSSIFYFLGRRINFKRIFLYIAIILLLISPMIGFGTITSGCPLYPSSLMCLNLPWSLGSQQAQEMSKLIQEWARWSGLRPVTANSWNWLEHWIKTEKQSAFMLFLSILSALIIVKTSKDEWVRPHKYVLTLGGLGIAFMMYAAPSLRFGLGYLCILPAYLMAAYSYRGSPFRITVLGIMSGLSNSWLGLSLTGLIMLGMTSIISLAVWFYSSHIKTKFFLIFLLFLTWIIPLKTYFLPPIYPIIQKSLILPPKLLTPNPDELVNKQINGINYVAPHPRLGTDQCWAAELPCTPSLTYEDIKLRDPESGIRKGFRRN